MAATPPNAAVLISVALQRGIPATALAKSIGWLPTSPLTRPIWKALDLGGRRPHQLARHSICPTVSRETDNRSGVHGIKTTVFCRFYHTTGPFKPVRRERRGIAPLPFGRRVASLAPAEVPATMMSESDALRVGLTAVHRVVSLTRYQGTKLS
jgi:hypothetical protein